ncbi:hypothetical protein QTG56_01600 [Rossellomorea sp. AcN35-11]|nr:hypothetical protein [Rossellomorea aquimaris]WJV29890.1 hypothetical protein QTG56_01600 [Rossellomorea sp. AcN35-11]
MEMKHTGILLSCMAILTFCVVKGVEEAARYISEGWFNSMSWYIYGLIFIVFTVGMVMFVKGLKKEGEK